MIYFIYFVCYLTREAYFLRYLMLCTSVCAWFSAALYILLSFSDFAFQTWNSLDRRSTKAQNSGKSSTLRCVLRRAKYTNPRGQ